jgi:hypothetical protein
MAPVPMTLIMLLKFNTNISTIKIIRAVLEVWAITGCSEAAVSM